MPERRRRRSTSHGCARALARVASRGRAGAACLRAGAVVAGLFAAGWLLPSQVLAAGDAQPAAFLPEGRVLPGNVLLLDAAKAGGRFVVVGERGRILFSDDNGKSWKVAASPVLTTLTSIAFVNDKNGVAVGHRGTVLLTQDGGTTWQRATVDAGDHNALLSVRMNGDAGMAVGAYGTCLETRDGGRTWTKRRILGVDFDRHLNTIIAGKDGVMLVAGESGTIAASSDGGSTWSALKSPYEGSYFGGLGLADGTMLVFGMRGAVFRTSDNGKTWTKVDLNHYKGAVQNGAELPDGSVVLVGAEGLIARSHDKGTTFKVQHTNDRLHIGGVVFGAGEQLLIMGEGGARWTDFTLPK